MNVLFTGKVGECMTSLAMKMYIVCRVNDVFLFFFFCFGLV